MDNFLYTAMTGAEHSLRALNVRANNLSNAQTSGFRADLASVTSQAARGYGYDSRYHATLTSTHVNPEPGKISETGRTLDVAIDGGGYLAVETAQGVAYKDDVVARGRQCSVRFVRDANGMQRASAVQLNWVRELQILRFDGADRTGKRIRC